MGWLEGLSGMVLLQGSSTSTSQVGAGPVQPGLEHRASTGVVSGWSQGKLPVESALVAAVQICPKLSLALGLRPSFHQGLVVLG